MSTPKDGGPAFPTNVPPYSGGMSLRDWFAGQCLEQFLRASAERDGSYDFHAAAARAYSLADAMLVARKS